MKYYKKLLCTVICLIVLVFGGCTPKTVDTAVDEQSDNLLRVHFIDVGQGDAAFIELPGGETMLIDAGESEYGAVVSDYIKKLGYSLINYVIGTHPHSDHIGGLEEVIRKFDVKSVYMPKVSANTKTFEGLLTAVKEKGLSVNTARKDLFVINNDNLKVKFLSPVQEKYSDLNDYSAVVMLNYKNNSFLFTGDAGEAVESSLEGNISCDVLKVGHHGSNTSSSLAFLESVGPEYAVISCGKDNKYGHPHSEAIDRLLRIGALVFRTDLSGDIVIESDGNNIMFDSNLTYLAPEVNNSSVKYILNTSSKKIHLPDCGSVAEISAQNKLNSNQTVDELIAQGYSPCGKCKPE